MNIDWNEVIPGKTVLVWDDDMGIKGMEFLVLHMIGDAVWISHPQFTWPLTQHKGDFKHFHIKENWIDVTEECAIAFDYETGYAQVQHNEAWLISEQFVGENAEYKRDGMRIFKRP